MHSYAQTVDEYIAAFDGARRRVPEALRAAILSMAPDAVESMQYRMPTYSIDGRQFAVAVQKHHLSVCVDREDLITRHAAEIGRHSRGKHCIRYRQPEHLRPERIGRLLEAVYGRAG